VWYDEIMTEDITDPENPEDALPRYRDMDKLQHKFFWDGAFIGVARTFNLLSTTDIYDALSERKHKWYVEDSIAWAVGMARGVWAALAFQTSYLVVIIILALTNAHWFAYVVTVLTYILAVIMVGVRQKHYNSDGSLKGRIMR
jgi:hypothetical protein